MNRTEHLLTCLSEECAEVAQRTSKALRFGLAETQPAHILTNAQRIVIELNDLLAVVEMLIEEGALPLIGDREAIAGKKAKVEKYLLYSKEQGTLL